MSNMNQPTRKPSQVTDKTENDKSKNYPISVYLTEAERDYIEVLAERLGVSRHSLMQFGVRYFIAQHRASHVEIPTETRTVTEIQSP